MQYLIDETCNDAKSKGAAKIMPHHLCAPLLPGHLRHLMCRKATINRLETFDFLRPLVASVPEPAADDPDRAKRKSSKAGHSNDGSNKTRGATGSKGRASRKVPPEANAGSLPMIGTWKKEEEGGVGSGQDGRGLYDDYEEDEEDY